MMDKTTDPSLFVDDGSFMERFKQLQKENKIEVLDNSSTLITSTLKTVISKTTIEFKGSGSRKTAQAPSGKLAFSLKQKPKLATPPVNFGGDDDEDDKDAGNSPDDGPMKRRKLVPPYPSDPTVKKVSDKLASFVAKNGRLFEHVTRQNNPGDSPFNCSDYKYYEYRFNEEEKALSQTRDSQTSQSGTASANSAAFSQRPQHQHSKYQPPEATENRGAAHSSSQTTVGRYGESSAPTGSDPIAMMEYYMKKAAEEEKLRHPKPSKDEMPLPPSLQAPKKGHHMGDYIPPEELEKFLAACNDAAAQKATKELADQNKIQADNVGHRLLSKMGWKEGDGLGSSKSGIAAPVMAGDVKKDNLGIGAHAPGEVTSDDDIYEQI